MHYFYWILIVLGVLAILFGKQFIELLRCVNVITPYRVNVFNQPYKKLKKIDENCDKIPFSRDRVPKDIDVIVIGSGVSGMTTAILNAQAGKKVLVLECNDHAGGIIGPFYEEGFRFEVGLHEFYNQGEGDLFKWFTDRITDKNLEFIWHDGVMDIVVMEEDPKKWYEWKHSYKETKKSLVKDFPESIVDKLLKMSNPDKSYKLFHCMIFPDWLANFKKYSRPLVKVMKDIAPKNELFRRVVYALEIMHNIPVRQCPAIWHFMNIDTFIQPGMFYAVGGTRQFVRVLCANLQQYGGQVLVNAPVDQVLVKEGAAVGVKLVTGEEIMAKQVVSSAGLFSSYHELLSPRVQKSINAKEITKGFKNGWGNFIIFVGLDSGSDKVDVPFAGLHLVQQNIEKRMEEWDNMKALPERGEIVPPVICYSFSSPRDETEWKGFGKFSLEVFFRVHYDWFAKWADLPCKARGNDYEELKLRLAQYPMKMMWEIFPQFEKYLACEIIGSPLSTVHYNRKFKGSGYGILLDEDAINLKKIPQIQSPIKNYFLTGTDLALCYGTPGATLSGYLTAGKMLKRQIFFDAVLKAD